MGSLANIMTINSVTTAALNASNTTLDRYFTNIKAATALSSDYVSVDYSLQLQLGIARAINAGQASLPTGLNNIQGRRPQRRSVATRLQEVVREEK